MAVIENNTTTDREKDVPVTVKNDKLNKFALMSSI